jgi:hypothetical protein
MSVSALTSKAGAFRKLLVRPLSSARSHFARFVGFLSSDIDAQILEVLSKPTGPELAIAVHLTDVVSQGLPLKRSTLDQYAQFITTVLKRSLQSTYVRPTRSPHYAFWLSIAVSNENELRIDDLKALVAALHRSRDGIAAEAVRFALQNEDEPYRQPVEELLNAEGELTVERSSGAITWKVTEIMPETPSGPTVPEISTEPRAIH